MRRHTLIALAAVGAIGLAGCGGDDADPAADMPAETEPAEDALTEDDTAEDDPAEGEPAEEDPAEDGDVVETINVEAGDLYFEGIPDTLPAGTIEIVLDNVGDMPHDVTIEELDDLLVVAAGGGESATGTVTLEPGEYTFYCAVPGHRPQMEVTVTVE
ncbi:hypothetical protein G1H11_20330 [Phytoactinopolyspora alkaliphila]|uniref:EfeO-type cupredoxin-like domain-containing protein n=1 Tax=Phytoactinopolyspora alkaliphila TaxID=1783498 RepID=A0A6N9YRT3_9ACTN|nr:cupredoxin domain-containing protein [Phytoactinopolyspora alkaliphila]NED97650.1 hypothetical protein [Phytoactinopolyspora alkaliphila]